jgi:hypothetical protein
MKLSHFNELNEWLSTGEPQIASAKNPIVGALCNLEESDTSAKPISNSLILLTAF